MESASAAAILLLVGALVLKHVICDGPLQTFAMVKAKRGYGQPLGLAHAAIHAGGTCLVCLLFGISLQLALLLALADGLFHYHIDFAKENIVRAMKWSVQDGPFWWLLTLDQALHHVTYLALAYVAFTRPDFLP